MRRIDIDMDDEISFSDFFSSILPYFLFLESNDKLSKRNRSVNDSNLVHRSFVGNSSYSVLGTSNDNHNLSHLRDSKKTFGKD